MNSGNQSPERLFNAALQITSPAQRAAFLDDACGGDVPLRQRVESLLQDYEQAGPFLEQPLAAFSPNALGVSTGTVPVTEKPGDKIGHYKLREQIGEGGCGVVYVAEQEEPVRRRVALKIVKLGMDTKQVVGRFEAERQALALMDHPNIAKVLDAGATDTGRPYFVMELVRGIRITNYCDQNNLSTEERLRLFVQVCHAIQHAHQKGIIHRDIKPSNILVTLHDGVPVPKVIDFGIAKATTDQRLTDKTVYTAFEQFIGTPAYMSPEQAEMSGLDIDTRSDIYAIGVLLYELLTGKTPFDAQRLVAAGLDEIRRIIREEEPPRPSTRISTLNVTEQTAVAKRHHAELPKLLGLIRGDLDWIVMKTLEKDRTRRYETANGLATDIQRHLNNEPVVARPPSSVYRFQKLVRRNKLAFAAAAALVTMLAVGITASTWLAVRATRAEREQRILRANESRLRSAEADARKHAEAEATRARQAQTQSEQRLAESLVAQGDALASDGRWDEARKRYREAEAGWQKLGLTSFPAQLALWETLRNSPPPLSTLAGHTGEVYEASFLRDGVHALSVGADQTIKEWDGRFGVAIGSSETKFARVACAAIASDGKRILVGTETGALTLWDEETKQPVRTWTAHKTPIRAVAIFADGRLCASGAADGSVKCWELESGREIRSFAGHQRGLLCLAFSTDGRSLLSGSEDQTAKVWEVATGELLQTFTGHHDHVFAVAFSPDGKYALSGSGDSFMAGRGTILAMWDIKTGSVYRSFEGHREGVSAVAFSPDGRWVLSGSWGGSVKLWDISSSRELQTFCGHNGRVWRVAFSDFGRRALSAAADGLVQIWPVTATGDSRPLTGLSGNLWSVALSPDGRLALGGCLCASNSWAKLWDTATGGELGQWEHKASLVSLALSPDARLSLAGQEDGTILLRDLASGHVLQSLSGHTGSVTSVTFAGDSTQCLSAGADGTVRLWDLVRGVGIRSFAHGLPLRVVRFSPDNQFCIAAGNGPEITGWELATGKKRLSLTGHQGNVQDLAFSTDGHRLLSASLDKTAKLWDLDARKELSTMSYTDPLYAVVFGEHDQFAFTGHFSGGINTWEAASGRVLRGVHCGSSVMSLAISTDRLSLLYGCHNHEVGLWDFSRVEAYAAFEPRLAAARQRLSPEHDDAKELALFGEWYAFRGVPEWGADLLERARKTGETVSSLMLACCYWRMNDLASARREFQRALDRKEAPASYLNLCLSAVTRGYAQYAASPSNALEEQRYQASSGDARSLNALAWLSATSPREDRRDGSIAVVLAERAAIATHRKDPAILDTLAAGLAEAGRFAEATRVQREAVKLLGDDKSKEDYGSRLKLYESNAPYRESAADDSAGAANDRLAMATLLRARGTLCAQFAQWTLATRELTKAITISPDEYWNWYQLAPLLLETGDVGGYRKHCHAMLVRFGATSAPPIAERTAKVCLMLPMPKEDLVLAAKLAETAVTVGKGQPWEPYFQFVKGLAEYRQGNFEKAAEWMQKTLTRDIPLAESKGQAYCVLAMAQHRLNRVAEAREALSKAANIAETKSPEIDSGDLGPNWHDWLIARALMREANILIEGGSKAGDQTK